MNDIDNNSEIDWPQEQEQSLLQDEQALEVKLDALTQRMADFIALQEAAVNNMAEEEQERKQEIQAYHQEFAMQIEEIKSAISEFQTMLTSVGVARFRVAALEALQQGREHLAMLQEQNEQFKAVTSEKLQYLERITSDSEKRVARLLHSLRIEYFKKLIDDGTKHVETVSETAVTRVSRAVKWFHWEKLGISVVVALIVTILMGLFINAEWPWETHQRVVAERDAGRLLLNAWPHLTKKEQHEISVIGQRR